MALARPGWHAESTLALRANPAPARARGRSREPDRQRSKATEFLQAALAGGPVPAAEVNRMAREH
jgi:hypothetical protein